MTLKGRIIGGSSNELIIRQKSDCVIELGELLVTREGHTTYLLEVIELFYGSQVSSANREMIAGLAMEQESSVHFHEQYLRQYTLVRALPLLTITNGQGSLCKRLPLFWGDVYEITSDDLPFISKATGMCLGYVRSGSRKIDTLPVRVSIKHLITHHMLIAATTGKGKSNLMSTILWEMTGMKECAMLVFDPHDEYYGRSGLGLKEYPIADSVQYYSPNPPPGQRTLRVNIDQIKPRHLTGVLDFSAPQHQCIQSYFATYKEHWIQHLIAGSAVSARFQEETLWVVRRQLLNALSLSYDGTTLRGQGIFCVEGSNNTLSQIIDHLTQAKTVIIDTSHLSSTQEVLLSSCIAHQLLGRYRADNAEYPVVSVVLEEALRVLGKDVLERGANVFATIAKEGRKFGIGICAITQLPSLIPKDILANMSTKIILGLEMAPERTAVIDSAAQDLSRHHRTIAALDKGEAIITSNFTRFATPVSIPLFKDVVHQTKRSHVAQKAGVKDPYQAIPELK